MMKIKEWYQNRSEKQTNKENVRIFQRPHMTFRKNELFPFTHGGSVQDSKFRSIYRTVK